MTDDPKHIINLMMSKLAICAFTEEQINDAFAGFGYVRSTPEAAEPVAPVAKIVMKGGEIVKAATYMPGLPDGEHDLYVSAGQAGRDAVEADCHGLDTAERVRFYEHDFYPLSNFSAFNLRLHGFDYATSEHAYHAEKFRNFRGDIADLIARAPSAHEAFKIAERYRHNRTPEWDEIKVGVMREILREKARQHEYVRRKLLATGDRELVEDSWRDDFWGWGPNRDGRNMLGKLWMEVRAELRAALSTTTGRAAE